MWHQGFNRNFTKLRDYFLCAKKTKIMSLFNNYISLHTKSILVASWCHMDYFTHLLATFLYLGILQLHCCLWEGQRALGFNKKYLNLFSEDERRSHGFGTTWGRVINDRIFIFWVYKPVQVQVQTCRWTNFWMTFLACSKGGSWPGSELLMEKPTSMQSTNADCRNRIKKTKIDENTCRKITL